QAEGPGAHVRNPGDEPESEHRGRDGKEGDERVDADHDLRVTYPRIGFSRHPGRDLTHRTTPDLLAIVAVVASALNRIPGAPGGRSGAGRARAGCRRGRLCARGRGWMGRRRLALVACLRTRCHPPWDPR